VNTWHSEVTAAVVDALRSEFPHIEQPEIERLVWHMAREEPPTFGAIHLLRRTRERARGFGAGQ